MDISIIPIGNSKGIRLNKAIIEQYHLTDTVELILKKDYIIIRPKTATREGWGEAFKDMHEQGDDQLLLPDILDDENLEEWS